MELVYNKRESSSKLDQLHNAAITKATRVDAAIAYMSADRPFLESCWNARKPLMVYGRYDHTCPISPPILDWFWSKNQQCADFELRLVPDIFHPKVIWWRGVGAYIGSANLSKRAWTGNFEAGVFLTEDELEENEMLEDLEDFFAEIQAASRSLTEDYVNQLKNFAALSGQADFKIEKEFQKARLIPPLESLVSVNRLPRRERNRNEFLREWNETLQYLLNIADRLALPENRPAWVNTDAPKGVLVDQFLHAFYYQRVRDGIKFPYREFYQKNCGRREEVLVEAIDWWRNLPSAPNNEDIHINEWAPEVRDRLAPGTITGMSIEEFTEVCLHIHAVREHARQLGQKAFGLEHHLEKMDRDGKTKYFAEWIYRRQAPNGWTPCDLIDFVLHGGPAKEAPQRLFQANTDPQMKIPHLGISSLGEMIGWAMPNRFPPRNGRTSKALTALGYNVKIHSEYPN